MTAFARRPLQRYNCVMEPCWTVSPYSTSVEEGGVDEVWSDDGLGEDCARDYELGLRRDINEWKEKLQEYDLEVQADFKELEREMLQQEMGDMEFLLREQKLQDEKKLEDQREKKERGIKVTEGEYFQDQRSFPQPQPSPMGHNLNLKGGYSLGSWMPNWGNNFMSPSLPPLIPQFYLGATQAPFNSYQSNSMPASFLFRPAPLPNPPYPYTPPLYPVPTWQPYIYPPLVQNWHLPPIPIPAPLKPSQLPPLLYRVFDDCSVSKLTPTGFTAGTPWMPHVPLSFAAMVERHAEWRCRIRTPFISMTDLLTCVDWHVSFRKNYGRSNIKVALIDTAILLGICRASVWIMQDVMALYGILPPGKCTISTFDNEYICGMKIPIEAVVACCVPEEVGEKAMAFLEERQMQV